MYHAWKGSVAYLYLVFLHEPGEGGALHLHRLADAVVQRDDEVEEVALPQVGGRLLLEVDSTQAHTESRRSTEASGRL